jgi:DDE family transposase
MVDNIVAVYSIMDDVLRAMGHREDSRCELTDAEVMTTALTAALYFGGNLETSRDFMLDTGLMPRMLSKSRFCRRLHRVADLTLSLFEQLGLVLKQVNASTQYLLDSFPVPVCDNIRIRRCRIVKGEEFRGKIASKRRYFYGVRVHVLATASGWPVELAFVPGRANDTRGLGVLPIELPAGSEVFMDSAYTDYGTEEAAQEADQITFATCRKKNSKRREEPAQEYYKTLMRKRIETVFSQITRWFPRHIHAVSFKGFLLKVTCFIMAFTLDQALI